MRLEDKKAKEEYLAKLARARSTGSKINPDESLTDKMNRIQKAKGDLLFFVETYMSHYATAECAPFQLEFGYMVKNDPLFKGYAEWFRGAAKSVWVDIIIPLWLWINKDIYYFCIASNTQDRASDLLEDLRAEFEGNEMLIHDFGVQKSVGQWEKGHFVTQNGFIGRGFGMRQNIRGLRKAAQRPDYWAIDDLESRSTIQNSKMQDKYVDWIKAEVLPTMVGARRRFIGANNRFAPRMVQTILREQNPDWTWHLIPGYDPVTYKSAWPAMYSSQYWRQQEKDLTVPYAHSEYNHVPMAVGKIFKEEMISYGPLPELNLMNAIVSHWDIAYAGNSTSDYNAVKIWGRHKKDFWLIDCFVKQSKMKLAVEWMCMKQIEFQQMGLVIFWQYESQFWNDEVQRVISETESEYGVSLNLMSIKNGGQNKLFRMLSMHPYYQNGRIWVNELLKASPDYHVGKNQLLAVEPGMTEHDDSPDADQQAIVKLEMYTDSPEDTKDNKNSLPYSLGKMKRKYTW